MWMGLLDVLRNYLGNYTAQHRHPWNRALHVAGVPLAPWGGLYLLVRGQLGAAAAALVAGYGLQWLGHRIEGNEMGDWKLVQQLAGRVTGTGRTGREEREAASPGRAARPAE